MNYFEIKNKISSTEKIRFQMMRFELVKKYLSDYDDFVVTSLLDDIKKKTEESKVGEPIGLAIFAVILLPFWEAYVNRYFDVNITKSKAAIITRSVGNLFIISLVIALFVFLIFIIGQRINKFLHYEHTKLVNYELIIRAVLYERNLNNIETVNVDNTTTTNIESTKL